MSANPYEQMQKMAERWFKANVRKLYDWPYELGFGYFVDAQGKVGMTATAQGEEAEVEWPEPPQGCTAIGSLHTHIGSDAALSTFDEEEGQKEADKTGQPYVMYVVGPDQVDQGGYELNDQEFEPGTPMAESVVQSLLDEEAPDLRTWRQEMASALAQQSGIEFDEGDFIGLSPIALACAYRRFVMGLSYREIAKDVIGRRISERTVITYVMRAVSELIEKFTQAGEWPQARFIATLTGQRA
jgi:hypothetical protein